jgi:hypothetical protein
MKEYEHTAPSLLPWTRDNDVFSEDFIDLITDSVDEEFDLMAEVKQKTAKLHFCQFYTPVFVNYPRGEVVRTDMRGAIPTTFDYPIQSDTQSYTMCAPTLITLDFSSDDFEEVGSDFSLWDDFNVGSVGKTSLTHEERELLRSQCFENAFKKKILRSRKKNIFIEELAYDPERICFIMMHMIMALPAILLYEDLLSKVLEHQVILLNKVFEGVLNLASHSCSPLARCQIKIRQKRIKIPIPCVRHLPSMSAILALPLILQCVKAYLWTMKATQSSTFGNIWEINFYSGRTCNKANQAYCFENGNPNRIHLIEFGLMQIQTAIAA